MPSIRGSGVTNGTRSLKGVDYARKSPETKGFTVHKGGGLAENPSTAKWVQSTPQSIGGVDS